jgi:hypothetical protein
MLFAHKNIYKYISSLSYPPVSGYYDYDTIEGGKFPPLRATITLRAG